MDRSHDKRFFYVESEVIKHFVLGFVASLISSAVLAMVEGKAVVLYFIVYWLYTFPSILVLGCVISYLIERWIVVKSRIANKCLAYLFKFVLYLIGGFVFITLYWVLALGTLPSFRPWNAFISTYAYGFIGALLYLHLYLLYEGAMRFYFSIKRPSSK
ncbi:hypothetical protein OMP38_32730 [Cohnella ginsengisoli]|uniref:Uncharacterized protein n=1 Tax=Cohnella ginsengisoli TaxID=425004 RepID=A0A9X4QQY2_9BACL|nr:hypothetical protein [Cohnella ginsengisoli]MDG0795066.1 hypothetical protein [Cohnella ginsengisoli]